MTGKLTVQLNSLDGMVITLNDSINSITAGVIHVPILQHKVTNECYIFDVKFPGP